MDEKTKQTIAKAEELFERASQESDSAKATEYLTAAASALVALGRPPFEPLGKIRKALTALDPAPVAGKKEKKCSYRMLSDGEIKKLKANGEDPHDIKGYDSEQDLFKCKPSGKLAIGRKAWHQDDNGNWVPGGNEYQDTCINIDSMPWPKKGAKKIMDEIIVEFRIGDLKKPIEEILPDLPLPPDKVHRKGQKRGHTILTHTADWFAYSAADVGQVGFERALDKLIEKLHPYRQKFRRLCGTQPRLACIFYFASNHRPLIRFPPGTLARINDMKASIDVDLYPMPSDEDEA